MFLFLSVLRDLAVKQKQNVFVSLHFFWPCWHSIADEIYEISNISIIGEFLNINAESCLHMSKEKTIPPHIHEVCSQRPLQSQCHDDDLASTERKYPASPLLMVGQQQYIITLL